MSAPAHRPDQSGGRKHPSVLGAAALVALIVAACAAPAPIPSPSPSEAAVTVPPGPTPAPTPVVTLSPEQIQERITEIEASVPPMRGLQPTETVPNRIVTEAEARADFERVVDEAATPEEYAAAGRLGQRLGYYPADFDLRDAQLDLLGDQVLGYYDEERDEMAAVQRDDIFGALEQVTIAHEYTHALQDQRFDLQAIKPEDDTVGDRIMARVALVEGDASLLTQQWALGNMTFDQLLEITREALDPAQQAVLDRVPRLMVRQLEFPYAEGLAFAQRLYESGGWAAVDAAYADPPNSTEQIIHPEKYLVREEPTEVAAPVRPKDLGKGWEQATIDTIGELGIATWLESAGPTIAADAAAGWAGDRVALLEGPDDAWLVAWATTWDTPEDAATFAQAAETRLAELDSRSSVRYTSGSSDVQVRIASAGDLLRVETP